jgi:hypothetical protein
VLFVVSAKSASEIKCRKPDASQGVFFTSQTESVRDIHSQIRNDFFLSRPDLHSLGDSALRYVNNQIRSDLFLSGPDLLSLGDSVL